MFSKIFVVIVYFSLYFCFQLDCNIPIIFMILIVVGLFLSLHPFFLPSSSHLKNTNPLKISSEMDSQYKVSSQNKLNFFPIEKLIVRK